MVEHNQCHYYKEDTNCWESLTSLPQSVGRFHSACVVDRGLLLTGGKNAMGRCWLFDFSTKKWEAMPPLITTRDYHRCVSLGNCVYVVGGRDVDRKVLASFECLNLKRKKWMSMPDMSQPVLAPMVVTYSNKIFVFGGIDAQIITLCCTRVFDTTRGQWSILTDMPEGCNIGAAVTLNGSIYVVGGLNRTCLKYDPVTDCWTRLHTGGRRWNNRGRIISHREVQSSHRHLV